MAPTLLMTPTFVFALLVASAAASSIDLSSSNLAGGTYGVDTVKATIDGTFEVGALGKIKAAAVGVADMTANSIALKEAKLSGALATMSYTVTHNLASGVTALGLSTKKLGATLKASLDSKSMLKEVGAVKAVDRLTLAPSYLLLSKVGKVQARYTLSDKAAVNAVVKASVDDLGSAAASFDLDYVASVGDTTLMMTVTPLEKSIDVDVKEGASGLVASASMGLDQAPTLSLKKSLSF